MKVVNLGRVSEAKDIVNFIEGRIYNDGLNTLYVVFDSDIPNNVKPFIKAVIELDEIPGMWEEVDFAKTRKLRRRIEEVLRKSTTITDMCLVAKLYGTKTYMTLASIIHLHPNLAISQSQLVCGCVDTGIVWNLLIPKGQNVWDLKGEDYDYLVSENQFRKLFPSFTIVKIEN